jgi:hypothetical protein
MASRKSSSKLASKSSIKSSPSVELTPAGKQVPRNVLVIITIVAVLYQGVILNYVMNLEDKLCSCIRDWRHDFIKYFSAAMIGWSFIILLLALTEFKNEILKKILKALSIALSLCNLINIWCLYTYVGDLNSTNCSCAIDKQKIANDFLYIWRYVLVAGVILGLVGVILSSLH